MNAVTSIRKHCIRMDKFNYTKCTCFSAIGARPNHVVLNRLHRHLINNQLTQQIDRYMYLLIFEIDI